MAWRGLLLSESGRELRAQAEALARGARAAELDGSPWKALLEAAERRGEEAGEEVKASFDVLADQAKDASDKRGEQRLRKEGTEAAKRATRRGRTEALDAGLALVAGWLRDVAATGDGAPDLALNADRARRAGRGRGGARPAPGAPGGGAGDGHAPAPERERFRGVGGRSARLQDGSRFARRLELPGNPAIARTFPVVARSIRNLGFGRRNPFGVRLYLAFAFAGVALITAGIVYLLVSESGSQEADERLDELAFGRTIALANEVEAVSRDKTQDTVDVATQEDFSVWVYDVSGKLITAPTSQGFFVDDVEDGRRAVATAQEGEEFVEPLTGGTTVVATPIRRDGVVDGVMLARAARPAELQEAIDAVRGDRITALLVALVVAVAISFLIASAITSRIKKLADSAMKISQGQLDRPLEGTGGRDEISDLGRSLETMRAALRQTFEALRSERDRLSAIFDALSDAVMVVGPDGTVRFSNPAARPADLCGRQGRGDPDPLASPRVAHRYRPSTTACGSASASTRCRRARSRPRAPSSPSFATGPTSSGASSPSASSSRTRRTSSATRWPASPARSRSLRGGAKDDREAREHFLRRLEQDTERITRLTDSLLTLARIESVGESGPEILDVAIACEEAAQAFIPPDGIGFEIEVEPDLAGPGRPSAPAPGADRSSRQRVQAQLRPRPRYASGEPGLRGGSPHRGDRHGVRHPPR